MLDPNTHGDLLRLRDLIQAYAGLRLEDAKLQALVPKLEAAMRDIGCPSLSALGDLLMREMAFGAGKAWTAVIPLVTINETYFFREMHQLEIFRSHLVPEMQRRNAGRRHLKILSAPCSTGAEPYTLAMLLEQGPANLMGWNVEIHGVDIDGPVVEQAREGLYPKAAFRATDQAQLERWFKAEGDRYRIQDRLRKAVSFRQGNLLEMAKWPGFRGFDVILCRNLLIYFDQPTQRRLVDLFFQALNPGGYLLLGHSESLLTLGTSFLPDPVHRAMVYYRPAAEIQKAAL